MTNLLPLINERLTRDLQILFYLSSYCARQGGWRIYAVGEFVRDLFLQQPTQEISLLIEGSAVDFAHRLHKLFAGRLRVMEKFGTVDFFLQDHTVLKMTTARREFSLQTADEAPGDEAFLKSDLYNRDFTIDTMACSLNTDTYGRLYDFFRGKDDLDQGLIRVLYKLSFVDEPLRVFRAVRSEQRYRFALEKETYEQLIAAGHNQLTSRLSKGRLYEEAFLIFKEPSPVAVLSRLKELGLLEVLFPRTRFSQRLFENLQALERILQEGGKSALFDRKKIGLTALYLTMIFDETPEHDLKYLLYVMRLKKKQREIILGLRERIPALLHALEQEFITDFHLEQLFKNLPEEAFPLLLVYGQGKSFTRHIGQHMMFRKNSPTLSQR
jgi:tRNA nucleotidyltransferase (CCA-adding enzyme)